MKILVARQKGADEEIEATIKKSGAAQTSVRVSRKTRIGVHVALRGKSADAEKTMNVGRKTMKMRLTEIVLARSAAAQDASAQIEMQLVQRTSADDQAICQILIGMLHDQKMIGGAQVTYLTRIDTQTDHAENDENHLIETILIPQLIVHRMSVANPTIATMTL
jgi:hypothetical protein